MSLFKFRPRYLLWSISFLLFETIIAIYAKDNFIRPYFGDTLAVLWLYATVKSFINILNYRGAILVLGIAYIIETLQYIGFIKMLGLQDELWAQLVLGTAFSWWDILAYSLGFLLIIMGENLSIRRPEKVN